jgi:hypothetical protein
MNPQAARANPDLIEALFILVGRKFERKKMD